MIATLWFFDTALCLFGFVVAIQGVPEEVPAGGYTARQHVCGYVATAFLIVGAPLCAFFGVIYV